MKHLRQPDFTPMPWRNGGGITHEIAKEEDADGLLWRISTARVEADCAYSRFPGLTRLSAVVEGNGVTLTDEAGQEQLVTPDSVAEMDGDQDYRGALMDGGIRHLNLIFNPKRVAASMTCVAKLLRLDGPDTHALYCVSGQLQVTETTHILPGEACLISRPCDVVFVDEAKAVHIQLAHAP